MCKLNEKFKEWEKWYSEDDNSVCAQIRDMLFDDAIFYVIYEARKYTKTDNQEKPELNKLVHDLINRSFLKTQSLSIRRLYEERKKQKDVISLRRLINDLKENNALITRENILFAIGLPYDYGKAIKSNLIVKSARSEYVHKNIDLLAGVEPAQRQPNDTVRNSMFDRLNKWLDKCKPIVNFVNKIVAHSATEESRGKVPEKDLRISRAKIHKGHGRIVKIAVYIGRYLLDEPTGWTNFLPSYGGNKFEHFEKPWVRKGNITKLENCWSQYERHIKQLCKWK